MEGLRGIYEVDLNRKKNKEPLLRHFNQLSKENCQASVICDCLLVKHVS